MSPSSTLAAKFKNLKEIVDTKIPEYLAIDFISLNGDHLSQHLETGISISNQRAIAQAAFEDSYKAISQGEDRETFHVIHSETSIKDTLCKADLLSTSMQTRRAQQDPSRIIQRMLDTMSTTHETWENTSASKPWASLKKLSIPKFSGDNPEEWDSWWEIFVALIGNNHRLTKLDKLLYLKLHVIGTAKEIIDYLPITGDSYDVACDLLVKCLGFSSLCQNFPLKKLRQLAVANTSDTPKEITCLYYKQFGCLKRMAIKESLGSAHKAIVKDAYPVRMQMMIHIKEKEFVQENNRPMSVDEFMNCLRFLVLVNDDGISKTSETTRSIHQEAALHVHHGPSSSFADVRARHKCMLCLKYGHLEHHCNRFTNLPDRIQVVGDKGLCNKCYGNHAVSRCKRSSCPKCQEQHGLATCPLWE